MGRRILLEGTNPPIEGLRWETDNRIRIGRHSDMDVVLDHPSISRHHAEVYFSPQGWVVRDVGSSGGTLVNGIRITQARALQPQDVLQVGKLLLTVAALEEDAPAAPTPQGPKHLKTSGDFVVRLQATNKRTWETALQTLASDNQERLPQGKHFLTLLRAGYHFANVAAMDVMLQSILDDTVALLGAQRGSAVLLDQAGELQPYAVSVIKGNLKAARSFSRTLAKRCFDREESILCRDVTTEADIAQARSVQDGTMASIICALLRSPRKRLGVLHFDRGPLKLPFNEDDLALDDSIAASVSVAVETAQLIQRQKEDYFQTLACLAEGVELRAPHLSGHSKRVAANTQLLAEALQLPGPEVQRVCIGAVLHDIGKITVADSILRKPGKLSPEELESVRAHTVRGAAMIESVSSLAHALPVIRSHHERWDGKGYPDGLAGQAIPLPARIVALANVFDVLTTDRPYRPTLSLPDAFGEIEKMSGSQFDPECVKVFVQARPLLEAKFSENSPADISRSRK